MVHSLQPVAGVYRKKSDSKGAPYGAAVVRARPSVRPCHSAIRRRRGISSSVPHQMTPPPPPPLPTSLWDFFVNGRGIRRAPSPPNQGTANPNLSLTVGCAGYPVTEGATCSRRKVSLSVRRRGLNCYNSAAAATASAAAAVECSGFARKIPPGLLC